MLLLLCIGGAVLISQLLIRRFGFRNLTYTLAFSADEVSEGDTVTLIETICSRKPLPLPWVKAELTTDTSLVFASEQSSVAEDTRFVSSFFCLYPYRKIERHWHVTCTKRGQFTVSHAVIVLSDLFGTTEFSQPYPEAEAQLTVLPAVLRLAEITEPPQQFTGEIFRRRTLMPDRFAVAGIRPYQDGDPVRDIAWTASARTDTPMVWQFQETAFPAMTVLLNLETRDTDRDRISDLPAFEKAVRLCAALLGEAERLRIPTRLCANASANGMPIECRLSSGTLHHKLRMLAEIPDTISYRFSHLAARVCETAQNTVILIVTAQPTADILRLAAANPEIHVYSLRPLRSGEQLPNIRHIALHTERIDDL